MIAAYALVVLGVGGLVLAVANGHRTPHAYVAAIISVAMGARYIRAQGRRSGA